MKIITSLFWVLLMQLTMTSAQAVMVTTSVEGFVTEDNAGNNPFGLVFDDSVFLDVTYDDALIAGNDPDEQHLIDSLIDWDFTITLGNYSFGQADVNDPTYTSFYFDNGVFDGVEFFLEHVDIGNYTDLLIEDFDGGRALFAEDYQTMDPIYLEAEWDFSTSVTRPVNNVPEPSVLLLMLTGLLGLALTKKKLN